MDPQAVADPPDAGTRPLSLHERHARTYMAAFSWRLPDSEAAAGRGRLGSI